MLNLTCIFWFKYTFLIQGDHQELNVFGTSCTVLGLQSSENDEKPGIDISIRSNLSSTIEQCMFAYVRYVPRKSRDIPWPRSPDLSICDFFLWGYLKLRICSHKLCTFNKLQEAFRDKKWMQTMVRLPIICESSKDCIKNKDGHHLPDTSIIWR